MARHFPVSQDFNSDGELWELTDLFGDRALRVWFEILAILDREKNAWALVSGWDSVLARKCRHTPAKVRRIVGHALAKGWLVCRQGAANGRPEVLGARNYAKYRKIAAEASLSPNLTEPNLTEPNNQEPASPAPSADRKPKGLDPRIKEVADRIYKSDTKKFQGLIVWIKEAEKYNYLPSVIAASLAKFEPHAAEIENWYPYLDKIIEKTYADMCAAQSYGEHEKWKESEILHAARNFKH